MNLINSKAHIFIPGGESADVAMQRTTHLCIAAHQDDVEIMAYGAIAECHSSDSLHFSAVVVTDGAGSPRTGAYAHMTDEEMQLVRSQEQDSAASIGKYAAMFQLAYPSRIVKDGADTRCPAELAAIIRACSPSHLYTHNPYDKHDTHVSVMLRTIAALRLLAPDERPAHIYGLEVWRSLDWLMDESKAVFDTAYNPELALELLSVFASQCSGGKRYDLAAIGRRLANATFFASHAVDDSNSCTYGLDLTPLLEAEDINSFIDRHIQDLRAEVLSRIGRYV